MYFLSINKVKQDADRARLGAVIPPHVQWLKDQIGGGRIVQAGKWGDQGGMAIVKAESAGEARALLEGDPLFRSGLITFEIAELWPLVEIK